MQCAISPCPNDTFAFDAWIHKKIASPVHINPVLHDIETLNQLALEGRYPITKVSAFCLGKITKEYTLLGSGAATGYNMGPKLIAKEPFELSALQDKVVAIPGVDTTANLLLQILLPKPKAIIALPYHHIQEAILSGKCDAGVIIHETRFSFSSRALFELADLGALFTKAYNCPIPLGVIVAKRALGHEMHTIIANSIKDSVLFAKKNPKSSVEYVQRLAQEKEASIIQQHIDLYVTDDTVELSQKALEALSILFRLAIERNLLPESSLNIHELIT